MPTGSHSTVRAWTAAGRLRVWWVHWAQDGWVWTDPAASSTTDKDREGETMERDVEATYTLEEAAHLLAVHSCRDQGHDLSIVERDSEPIGAVCTRCDRSWSVRTSETVASDGERLDRALVENELLREAFWETQVAGEDRTNGFFVLRVPRRQWLRLRAWRAADPGHGRAASRWWRFSFEELQALHAVINHSSPADVPAGLHVSTMAILDELWTERAAREHDEGQS